MASPAQASTPRLSVASHNVMFLSQVLFPNWAQGARADLIAEADFMRGHDIIAVQEAFAVKAGSRLRDNLAGEYPHMTPVVGRSTSGWDDTGGSFRWTKPENGGVFLASKWPITRQEQHVFERGCGIDALANKGIAYAELDVDGSTVHAVSAHLQSEDPGCDLDAGEDASVRASQLQEIRSFLDAKAIPEDEQVVIAGDLNITRGSEEHLKMLAALGADDPTWEGGQYSFDPVANSVARDRYEGDRRETLDYVLLLADHAGPADWTNTVLDRRSPEWSVTSWGKTYTYDDYSDHYPVIGG